MNPERLKARRKFNDEIRQRIDLVAADMVVSKSDIPKVSSLGSGITICCSLPRRIISASTG